MCDTLVATAPVTGGPTRLAKNSDRRGDEAQAVELVPGAPAAETGRRVRTTWAVLPRSGRRRTVLLCRPYWMWGAEMGVNDAGLAIANEAIFARGRRFPMRKAPLGMDLLRLALESADDVEGAVELLGELVERFGQGGPCEREGHFAYDNTFVVADPRRAWILETVGRTWAVRPADPVDACSNGLTIRGDHRLRSGDVGVDEDFAGRRGDPVVTFFARAAARRARGLALLEEAASDRVGVASLFAALRDHGGGAEPPGHPFAMTLCNHGAVGPVRRAAQTTGSLVADLARDRAPVAWVTGTAAPCTSIFRPVVVDGAWPAPPLGPTPDGRADLRTRWWRHERLHRYALGVPEAFRPLWAADAPRLEAAAVDVLASAPDDRTRAAAARTAWREADAAEARWLAHLDRTLGAPPPPRAGLVVSRYWRTLDRTTGLAEVAAAAE